MRNKTNVLWQIKEFGSELGSELRRDAQFRRNVLIIVGVAFLIVVLVVASVHRNNFEKELIASGICEPITEALYQPPPTYTCVSRNADGICTMQTPIYSSPYMRTLWRCEGHDDFWRRSNR